MILDRLTTKSQRVELDTVGTFLVFFETYNVKSSGFRPGEISKQTRRNLKPFMISLCGVVYVVTIILFVFTSTKSSR